MARLKDRTRQFAGRPASTPPAFRTATYARLSVGSVFSDSDSIRSQQMLMRDFLKGREEFVLVREFKDDGISGTRFDRQGFDRLLAEVREGNVNCIIVKDFSRFGRDHIEVGNYLEKIFPFLGVRFIAVDDGYDSFSRDSGEKKLAVVLKNLVNEYVAKDISVKVACAYAAKQENGEYDGGCAPYGYRTGGHGAGRFSIDEKPAAVVKEMFSWAIGGETAAAIVKKLTEMGVNPPKAYRETGDFYRGRQGRRYWSEATVNGILSNMAYAGHMALHKWKGSKADGTRPSLLPETEWKIVRNAHEAIVPERDFLLVQKIRRERKERYGKGHGTEPETRRGCSLPAGKVFCGDCLLPAKRIGANYKKGDGKIRVYRYRCRTYGEKGDRECTAKSVAGKMLEEIVYRAVTGYICRLDRPEEKLGSWIGSLFRQRQAAIGKEIQAEETAIRQRKNEKIRLYREYCRRREAPDGSGQEQQPDGKKRGGKGSFGQESPEDERYALDKRKAEEEIRFHEKRKAELCERAAWLGRREAEQEEGLKEALLGKGELPAGLAALFVDRIFLYEGKRVELVLNFREGPVE